MDPQTERRMWSTTPKRLSAFVDALFKMGILSTSVRNLQKVFKERGIYPARDFPQFCTAEAPDAFFSYHSAENFVNVQEIVWQTFDYAARQLQRKRPGLTPEALEPMIADGIRLWVDFMFIDQSARDLREELTILPRLLQGVSTHFVLGSQTLMRAWCCYEIALFNQSFAAADTPQLSGPELLEGPGIRSFFAPTRAFYLGWEKAETSDPEDKAFIEERISTAFPSGFDGFDRIMAQANTIATLQFAEVGTVRTTPAANENLDKAVENWYKRSFPEGAAR
jgi:hypothetical protein